MKKIIVKLLKGCAVGRWMYEPLHKLYRLYSVPHRRRLLRRNGKEVLAEVVRILKKYDVPGFAASGTLLGFVRDGGFIPHDDDLDIGVLPNSKWTPARLLRHLLEEEKGFSFMFAFSFRGALTEFKVEYKKVPIDFYFYHLDGDDYYCTCYYYFPNVKYPDATANSVRRIHEHKVDSLGSINVFGIEVPVPKEPEKTLESLYGKSWRIPNAGWDDCMHPGVEDMPDFGRSHTKEEAINME